MKQIPPLEELRESFSKLSLTTEEKQRLGQSLREYQSYHPLPRAQTPVRKNTTTRYLRQTAPFYTFILNTMKIATILVITMLMGGGVAFAAETSLPGSPLYPIKTHVNERVRAAFAVNAEAKAELNSTYAEKRINEAERLQEKGKLTAATAAKLEAEASVFADTAVAHALSVNAKGSTDAALEILTKTEAILRSGAELFAGMNVESNLSATADKVAESKTTIKAGTALGTGLTKKTAETVATDIDDLRAAIVAAQESGELSAEEEATLEVALLELDKADASLEGEAVVEADETLGQVKVDIGTIIDLDTASDTSDTTDPEDSTDDTESSTETLVTGEVESTLGL